LRDRRFDFLPQGTLLETIPVPERVSNCTFGGPDGNTLFITATTSLYRVTIAPPVFRDKQD
jgi:gluconolactonase